MVTAAGWPDGPAGPVLVATKLHVPVARAGLVSRGELVGRLAGAGEHKLVLVCAPAGWGKTSVLSQWQRGLLRNGSLDPGSARRLMWRTLWRRTIPRHVALTQKPIGHALHDAYARCPPVARDGTGGGSDARP